MTRQDRIAALKAASKERVLILDGSWGVMIQKRGLAEADRWHRVPECESCPECQGNSDGNEDAPIGHGSGTGSR